MSVELELFYNTIYISSPVADHGKWAGVQHVVYRGHHLYEERLDVEFCFIIIDKL